MTTTRERIQAALGGDPRLDPDHVRIVDDIVLVGVVHDHPASSHRVRAIIDAATPSTVALELPPVALPLFEARAGTEDGSGEMSTAIDAAGDADVVAIDTMDISFFRLLLDEFRADEVGLSGMVQAVKDITDVAQRAISCNLAVRAPALVSERNSFRPIAHEIDATASPTTQATDERRQITQSRSLLRAIERPAVDRLIDSSREQNMTEKLQACETDGPVVGVVGYDHLDEIADSIATTSE